MDISTTSSQGGEGGQLGQLERVMAAVRRRIAARALPPGAKLPSIRGCAKTMGVSTSTVAEAYGRLVAEGAVQARPGSGFYVTRAPQPLALAEIGPRLERAVDPFWVSRQSLEAGRDVQKPGCGWLPADWMPEQDLRRALRAVSRAETSVLTDYGTPLGHAPLRQLLSRRMEAQGVVAPPAQILLTESGTQAIDMLLRLLVEPGDTVLVDDPCYFNFLALLRAHRVEVVGVPMTSSGPDVEAFATVVATHRPRLYITNAAIHNPTGAVLSPAIAHRLLALCEAADVTVIEDDIFGDFEEVAAPRLAALDGLQRVIQIGSFSKTLTAAARCGYIAARPEWIAPLVYLKIATSFGGSPVAAELTHALLRDGSYRRHLNGLRERLARATSEVRARLGVLGIHPWIEPRGGLFLWCALPDGIDAAAVARRAMAQDVVLAPGNVFSVSQTAGGMMRFNVAQCGHPRVFSVLARAMEEAAAEG
ncbi:MAG: PLP-dependent aminotransferase family protein [Alphaproteobacteria bacterium]|nr:PLP-dependent aminotransferase family protein [Alphaproteobacteria bacterium]MBU1551015.1 PLP-dependent aminotransferase family protein [Alphaproteobacteria bacterium]MBU2339151.1 PLP-dependent aminotransferase family protein [Alphaproteobacteria bacterium]MBU2387242.1 PLP-dependent aminotransferase family protein [Alphaproteobacteria bacterium]